MLNFGIAGIPGFGDDAVSVGPPGLLQFFLVCPHDAEGNPNTSETMPHQHANRGDMNSSN